MATNLDVIQDALGLLGVLSETETASAEQGEHGLRVLNDLMEDWLGNNIDVGQWPQIDLSAEFPAPSTTTGTVKAMLAVWLAPYYEREPRPMVMAMASTGYNRLLRNTVAANLPIADMSHTPLGEGHGSTWNILTDS